MSFWYNAMYNFYSAITRYQSLDWGRVECKEVFVQVHSFAFVPHLHHVLSMYGMDICISRCKTRVHMKEVVGELNMHCLPPKDRKSVV